MELDAKLVIPDGIELWYDGSKNYWRARTSLDILLVHHIAEDVLELVLFDQTNKVELPRKYIDGPTLFARVERDDLQDAYKVKKKINDREHMNTDPQHMFDKLMRELIIQHVLSRIEVIPPCSHVVHRALVLYNEYLPGEESENSSSYMLNKPDVIPIKIPRATKQTKSHRDLAPIIEQPRPLSGMKFIAELQAKCSIAAKALASGTRWKIAYQQVRSQIEVEKIRGRLKRDKVQTLLSMRGQNHHRYQTKLANRELEKLDVLNVPIKNTVPLSNCRDQVDSLLISRVANTATTVGIDDSSKHEDQAEGSMKSETLLQVQQQQPHPQKKIACGMTKEDIRLSIIDCKGSLLPSAAAAVAAAGVGVGTPVEELEETVCRRYSYLRDSHATDLTTYTTSATVATNQSFPSSPVAPAVAVAVAAATPAAATATATATAVSLLGACTDQQNSLRRRKRDEGPTRRIGRRARAEPLGVGVAASVGKTSQTERVTPHFSHRRGSRGERVTGLGCGEGKEAGKEGGGKGKGRRNSSSLRSARSENVKAPVSEVPPVAVAAAGAPAHAVGVKKRASQKQESPPLLANVKTIIRTASAVKKDESGTYAAVKKGKMSRKEGEEGGAQQEGSFCLERDSKQELRKGKLDELPVPDENNNNNNNNGNSYNTICGVAPTEANYLAQLAIEEGKAVEVTQREREAALSRPREAASVVVRSLKDGALILEDSPTKAHILLPSLTDGGAAHAAINTSSVSPSSPRSGTAGSGGGVGGGTRSRENRCPRSSCSAQVVLRYADSRQSNKIELSALVNNNSNTNTNNNSNSNINTPSRMTDFIGSRREVATLVQALDATRLFTLPMYAKPSTTTTPMLLPPHHPQHNHHNQQQQKSRHRVETLRAQNQASAALLEAAAVMEEANAGMRGTVRRMERLLKEDSRLKRAETEAEVEIEGEEEEYVIYDG